MKKLFVSFLLMTLVLSFVACSNPTSSGSEDSDATYFDDVVEQDSGVSAGEDESADVEDSVEYPELVYQLAKLSEVANPSTSKYSRVGSARYDSPMGDHDYSDDTYYTAVYVLQLPVEEDYAGTVHVWRAGTEEDFETPGETDVRFFTSRAPADSVVDEHVAENDVPTFILSDEYTRTCTIIITSIHPLTDADFDIVCSRLMFVDDSVQVEKLVVNSAMDDLDLSPVYFRKNALIKLDGSYYLVSESGGGGGGGTAEWTYSYHVYTLLPLSNPFAEEKDVVVPALNVKLFDVLSEVVIPEGLSLHLASEVDDNLIAIDVGLGHPASRNKEADDFLSGLSVGFETDNGWVIYLPY